MPDILDPSFNPEAFLTINGVQVEKDVLGVVAEVSSRWPNLRIQFLDPDSAPGLLDAPYQIIETDLKGRDRVILQVWKLDRSVISHLEAFDSHRGFDLEKYLADVDKRRKRAQDSHWENLRGEMLDITTGVFNSNKDTYTFTDERTGKTVKTRQSGPHEVVKES